MQPILFKNACVLSMDTGVGNLENGDVLIENGLIKDVGVNLDHPTAKQIDAKNKILMPGLVNAHIHTWEYQLRGIGSDWVGSRDYHNYMHKNLATFYNKDDVYLGNLLGSLNQLRNGTTTIVDWCHIVRDSEMTDAAIAGLDDAGIRAVFARGTVKPPEKAGEIPFHKLPYPREEIRRLRVGRFASDDQLMTLAMAILGPDWGEYEVAKHDILLAREYGLINSAHTYGRVGSRVVEDGYNSN